MMMMMTRIKRGAKTHADSSHGSSRGRKRERSAEAETCSHCC